MYVGKVHCMLLMNNTKFSSKTAEVKTMTCCSAHLTAVSTEDCGSTVSILRHTGV